MMNGGDGYFEGSREGKRDWATVRTANVKEGDEGLEGDSGKQELRRILRRLTSQHKEEQQKQYQLSHNTTKVSRRVLE